MQSIELTKPITTESLLSEFESRFNQTMDVSKFTKEELEDYANKIRTKIHEITQNTHFGQELKDDNYQKSQMMLDIVNQAINLGIKIYFNYVVTNTFGYRKIKSLEIMELSDNGNTTIGNKTKLDCDCLGISGGWTPMVHMHTQSGGKLNFRDEDQVFLPEESSKIGRAHV